MSPDAENIFSSVSYIEMILRQVKIESEPLYNMVMTKDSWFERREYLKEIIMLPISDYENTYDYIILSNHL